ncbi:hypothetical protein IC575_009161 [Cucumis melo]
MNASKESWMSHNFFNKLSYLTRNLLMQKTSLGDDLQYSRMEEIDRIYGFLVGLNPKFDIVRGHILHQRPIPSLMEVYYEIRLEENCTSAMSILATPNIDFAAFSARSSNSGSDKHDRKPIPVCENSKKQWHTKEQYWKLHGRSPGGKKRYPNDKQNTGWAYVSESSGPSQPLDPHGKQTYFSPATLGAIVQSGIPQSFSFISVDGKNP